MKKKKKQMHKTSSSKHGRYNGYPQGALDNPDLAAGMDGCNEQNHRITEGNTK